MNDASVKPKLMNPDTTMDARAFLAKRYAAHFQSHGIPLDRIPDHFDLFVEGVIDSLGIMELVAAVEEQYGYPLDFEGLDAEQVTVFGPLADYIDRKLAEARQAEAAGPGKV